MTIYADQLAGIAAGKLNATQPIVVVGARVEWAELLRGLRENSTANPQLGRVAWKLIAHIEGALIDAPETE